MWLDKSLIKAILEQLEQVYPNFIEEFEDIQKEEKDRDKLVKHLSFLSEENLISCQPVFESNDTVECKMAKITSAGIKCLCELS